MPRAEEDARAIFAAAVRGAQADAAVARANLANRTRRSLESYRRVVVCGMGKAALAMASALKDALPRAVDSGAVVVPEGYPAHRPERFAPPERIAVMEAAHPVPNARSLAAGERMLRLAERCGTDDLLLVLISGGGTALCTAFAEGITLEDAQQAYRLLLQSGADIRAMNAVRKHLSRLGGGGLVRAARPAETVALAISDVVGDDLAVIASGPTVPDPSTFADAVAVLRERSLWKAVPAAVRTHLGAGRRGEKAETPKPGDALFERVRTHLIGTNRDALEAAAEEAEGRGYAVRILGRAVTGEAREVARRLMGEARRANAQQATCLLWGGETTVTVTGSGKGGRNQELALAAALAMDGARQPAVFLSGGTDGIDGPTDAAGAWATPRTAAAARTRGLDPEAFLKNNDAYSFFDRIDQLLRPGPTHTNVMDVQMALLR